jgi:hypothetical protein
MTTRNPYAFELKPAAVIAGSATGQSAAKVTDGNYFVVTEMYSIVENTAGTGSALARSALPLLAGTQASTATQNTMNMMEAKITIGQRDMSDAQLPICFVALPPSENGVLRDPIVIPPQTSVTAAFTNNCSGPMTPRIVMKGYQVPPNEWPPAQL